MVGWRHRFFGTRLLKNRAPEGDAILYTGGRLSCQWVACSQACSTRSTVASSKGLPAICMARGRTPSPSVVNPHRIDRAEAPVRL